MIRSRERSVAAGALVLSVALTACGKIASDPSVRLDVASGDRKSSLDASRADTAPRAAPPAEETASFEAHVDVSTSDGSFLRPAARAPVDAARRDPVILHVPFGADRESFVVMPRDRSRTPRLLAMIHGVCTPPSYVCGSWKEAATATGLLVCPTGNATCGPDGTGAPSWEEPFADIDADLETAIAAVGRRSPAKVVRPGAVLAGYSRGGYAAVILAIRHPGRWPYLIVNEADVDLTVPMLRAAGVRAVALIAGEWGTQLAGERRTVDSLASQGYPAKLWVMPRTGHPYSADIDDIMRESLDFVLLQDADASRALP